MFRGKKYQDAAKQIEKNTQYDAAEAVSYTHLTLPTTARV